jgi:hypothetical protein
LYTVLRTAALQKIDTYAYLIDVLEKLASSWPAGRIDELMPEQWAASRAPQPVDSVPA